MAAADAHRAVEGGTVGKVLVDITSLRTASGWPWSRPG
jgi:hypothetical protein